MRTLTNILMDGMHAEMVREQVRLEVANRGNELVKLASAREGLNLRQLGRKLKISHATLSCIRSGKWKPTPAMVYRIANYLAHTPVKAKEGYASASDLLTL